MIKKIILTLLLIVFCYVAVFAQSDTIYLAANFIDDNITSPQINSIMNNYNFRILSVSEKNDMGITILFGETDTEPAFICARLYSDSIVNFAHIINSIDYEFDRLKKNKLENKFAQLNLLLYGSELKSILYEKLNNSEHIAEIGFIIEMLAYSGNEYNKNQIIEYLDANWNSDEKRLICLNSISEIIEDTISQYILNKFETETNESIKFEIIISLRNSNNSNVISKMKNILNDNISSTLIKIGSSLVLALNKDTECLGYIRNIITSQNPVRENLVFAIQILGLIGDSNDIVILNTIRQNAKRYIMKILDRSIMQIEINNNQNKLIELENLIRDVNNDDLELKVWALLELLKVDNARGTIILKEQIKNSDLWDSSHSEEKYMNQFFLNWLLKKCINQKIEL